MIIIFSLRLTIKTFEILYIFYYGLVLLKFFDLSYIAKLKLIEFESRINKSKLNKESRKLILTII